MPYKTSRSRKNLQTAYSGIYSVIAISKRRTIDPKIKDYVIAAAIFLAHAELENFVADIFSAFAIGAQSVAKKGSLLPKELRSHLFLSKANTQIIFGKYLTGGPEKDVIRSFISVLNGPVRSIVDDSTELLPFNGSDIFSKQKYPSKDNLKKLFFRIGIDNVFDKLSAYLKQDSIALLESLSSLRTQLAHTGTLPGISSEDVKNRIVETERFVGAMDRLIYSAVSTNFGYVTWRSHLC